MTGKETAGMSDLIRRSDVLALLEGGDTTGYKPSALREMVERLPSLPQPKPASWVQPHPNTLAACPECGEHTGGYVTEGKWFCSACGAKMGKEDVNDG